MGIVSFVATALLAQAPVHAGKGTISAVEVRLPAGTDFKLLDDSPSLIAVHRGQAFSKRAVSNAIENLYATGRFSDIEVLGVRTAEGIQLIFKLTPQKFIVEVYTEGNKAVLSKTILDAARLRKGAPYAPEGLAKATQEILTLYSQQGFHQARVTTRTQSDDKSGAHVGFLIEEGAPLRMSSLAFVGTLGLPVRQLRDAFGMAPEAVLRVETIEKGLARLRALFRREKFYRARIGTARVRADGSLVLPILSGPRLSIFFSGNAHFADSTLLSVLEYDGEDALDTLLTARLARRLRHFYRYRGFHDVRVTTTEVLQQDTKAVALGFLIEEGLAVRVADVQFVGNRAVTDSKLRAVLLQVMEAAQPTVRFDVHPLDDALRLEGRHRASVAASFSSPPLDTVLVEEALSDAAHAMTALYQQLGYPDAEVKFESATIEYATAQCRFRVREGPLAHFHSLTARGMPPNFTARSLKQPISSQVFSMQKLEDVRRRLLQELHNGGYLFAQVTATHTRVEGAVDAVLQVTSGPQVQTGAIFPIGNQRTKDAVILRQAAMARERTLDVRTLETTETNLLGLGIFRSTEVTLLAPKRPEARKTVLLKVRERPRVYGEFGLGYFLADGPRFVVDLAAPNLGGLAINLHTHAQVNLFPLSTPALTRSIDVTHLPAFEQIGWRVNVTASSRSLLPKDYGLRTDVISERVFRRQFRFTRLASIFTIDWQTPFHIPYISWLRPKLLLAAQYELDFAAVFPTVSSTSLLRATNPLDIERLRFRFGEFFLHTARLNLTLDLRDDAVHPHKGLLLKGTVDVTGALSAFDENRQAVSVNFTKLSALISGYVPLGKRVVWASSARAGRIFHLAEDSSAPPIKRFFMGGATSMRGFNEDQLLAEDQRAAYREALRSCAVLVTKNGCPPAVAAIEANQQLPSQGGEFFALFKTEIRFPVFNALEMGVFFEMGNLWLAQFDTLWPLRSVTGAGLRYLTPVGPLALDVGVNLAPDRRVNETNVVLHFNIGVF